MSHPRRIHRHVFELSWNYQAGGPGWEVLEGLVCVRRLSQFKPEMNSDRGDLLLPYRSYSLQEGDRFSTWVEKPERLEFDQLAEDGE